MPHPDNGIATNATVREVTAALEVLGTADLATEVTLNDILTALLSVINESDEIKASITGDIEIGAVQVDNVQLIDADGHKPDYTADGESKTTIADGKNVALGTTTDLNTADTVVGLMKYLKSKMDYLISLDEITTMTSGDIEVNDTTPVVLKVGAEKLSGRKRVLVTNNGAYNIRILESESATGILVLTGTTVVLTYSGDLWLKSVSGTFDVNIAEIA